MTCAGTIRRLDSLQGRLLIGLVCSLLVLPTFSFSQVDHSTVSAEALFRHSDIRSALSESVLALNADPADARALFVAMEASALDANDSAVLDFATRLCAIDDGDLCEIAAARIYELAGNTKSFRAVAPRLQRLIATGNTQSGALRLSLVAAAADGAPEFDVLMKSRESGLLTDWRIVGPLGKFANSDFDRIFGPEHDGLRRNTYASRRVTNFQFYDGKVEVPEAQRAAGVYFASAKTDLGTSGEYRIWVESPGTLEVFLDGVSVLRKDDRTAQQPQVAWKIRRLDSGAHNIIVKFLPSALPFRVAVMPPTGGVKRKNSKPQINAGPESEYVSVALRYWRRDYIGTVRQLQLRRASLDAASVLLLARAWENGAIADASEARAALLQASRTTPDVPAIRLALGTQAAESDRIDDALAQLKPVLTGHPENESARRLFAQLASRLHWRTDAANAYERLAQQHPSCRNLREAAWYLAGAGEYSRAEALVPSMKTCAPASLLYASWLAQSGRHAESARATAALASQYPLDRDALSFQLEQARLAGDRQLATLAESNLSVLSPEDPPDRASIAGLAENPRAAGFSDGEEFYSPYRRDGVKLVRDLRDRKFSGGPAVILLHDKVASLSLNGHTAVYVHSITRVLDRDGIQRFGEVSLPAGVDLLELRTVKPDGTTIEPELNQHKSTVSMPALTPGDAIEIEYVVYDSGNGGVDAHRDAFEFVFGSFAAPIVISRFVVISPPALEFKSMGDVPRPSETRTTGGLLIRTWTRNDIAQSTNEGMLPAGYLLPTVRASVSQDQVMYLRSIAQESAISASRVGLRTVLLADSIAQTCKPDRASSAQGSVDYCLARALYARVVSSINADGSDFTTGEVTPAEETLASRQGSRTAALLALGRAAGLQVSMALARTIADGATARYAHPLVVFHLEGREIIADAEGDDMPFAVLSPALDRSTALAVPLESPETPLAWLKLPQTEGDHLSIAEGDIVFNRAGTFTARVTIIMGAWRATQMRNILRDIPRDERRHFFEQLAMRLFPGASDADGSVSNESALDRPLKLEVTCTSPHFLDMSAPSVDIDQLVPTLGLRRMYASQFSRRWPLFIDSLLFESANFRVHLPDGIRVARRIPDADLRSEFGSYRASFTPEGNGELVVRREFRIPVQIVPAARYPDFVAFANRIDDIERQRLTLGIDRTLISTEN